MEFAEDPIRGDEINVAEYIRRHGQRGAGEDMREPCRCPACSQVVRPRGELTPNAHQHFAHLRGCKPCPTQARAAEPYLRLTPTDPDPEHAVWLRQAFLEDAERAIEWLRGQVPYFSPDELDEMLASAARVRLWEHRYLQVWQVPLCLLMMRDFPPHTSLFNPQTKRAMRELHFRFWFDPGVRTLDDLWIRKPGSVDLFSGTYRPVAGNGVPGEEQFIRAKTHRVTPALALERPAKPLSAPLRDWFGRILSKHLP